jgi:hypothetical protein
MAPVKRHGAHMNSKRIRCWHLAVALLMTATTTVQVAPALDFMQDMKEGQQFNESALQAIGKSWDSKDYIKWIGRKLSPSDIADAQRFMSEIQQKVGPMKSYTRARKANLLHNMTPTGDVVTCESNFDLDCAKGKATAKIMSSRDGAWRLSMLDVDSPKFHEGAAAVVDKQAMEYNDHTTAAITQSWDQSKLMQAASPELRAVFEKDPNALPALFNTYKTMLGSTKSHQPTKLVTNAIKQDKYYYAFETPYQFERTSANVQTQIVGDRSGWHVMRFNVQAIMGK